MIRLEEVVKSYGGEQGGRRDRAQPVQVLHGIDLHVAASEAVAILGPSGSGKSTLLHVMGLIHQPTGGKVWLDGVETSTMDDDTRSRFRGRTLAFVFQRFHLIPHLSVQENVELPLFYQGVEGEVRKERAAAQLERVGLGHRTTHHPNELSGGECQRAAIARALVTEAPILFADEPTGNLDQKTGESIFKILEELPSQGTTLVMITHDRELAHRMPRQVSLRDGKIVEGIR